MVKSLELNVICYCSINSKTDSCLKFLEIHVSCIQWTQLLTITLLF